jgi:HIRAN domain
MKIVCTMVGMKYKDADRLVESLPTGVSLTLVRDAQNQFDANAVQVWMKTRHIAFIARDEVPDVARYMDRNHLETMPARLVFVARQPNVEVLL